MSEQYKRPLIRGVLRDAWRSVSSSPTLSPQVPADEEPTENSSRSKSPARLLPGSSSHSRKPSSGGHTSLPDSDGLSARGRAAPKPPRRLPNVNTASALSLRTPAAPVQHQHDQSSVEWPDPHPGRLWIPPSPSSRSTMAPPILYGSQPSVDSSPCSPNDHTRSLEYPSSPWAQDNYNRLVQETLRLNYGIPENSWPEASSSEAQTANDPQSGIADSAGAPTQETTSTAKKSHKEVLSAYVERQKLSQDRFKKHAESAEGRTSRRKAKASKKYFKGLQEAAQKSQGEQEEVLVALQYYVDLHKSSSR